MIQQTCTIRPRAPVRIPISSNAHETFLLLPSAITDLIYADYCASYSIMLCLPIHYFPHKRACMRLVLPVCLISPNRQLGCTKQQVRFHSAPCPWRGASCHNKNWNNNQLVAICSVSSQTRCSASHTHFVYHCEVQEQVVKDTKSTTPQV